MLSSHLCPDRTNNSSQNTSPCYTSKTRVFSTMNIGIPGTWCWWDGPHFTGPQPSIAELLVLILSVPVNGSEAKRKKYITGCSKNCVSLIRVTCSSRSEHPSCCNIYSCVPLDANLFSHGICHWSVIRAVSWRFHNRPSSRYCDAHYIGAFRPLFVPELRCHYCLWCATL
jgi:hypothetical protein